LQKKAKNFTEDQIIMPDALLVRPLFDGPLDIVADVHGEIDALRSLLARLGYSEEGRHAAGRRLVFVGDLVDRGPDSPAVVRLVAELVFAGRAQCVLGNHELNVMLRESKHGNAWFFGRGEEDLDRSGRLVPMIPADEAMRAFVLGFFSRLPLVLERPDLRVVHACWHPELVAAVREERCVLRVYERYRVRIEETIRHQGITNKVDRGLLLQNHNPIKVLTSGLEQRTVEPYEAGGKVREEERVEWWQDYRDEAWCVFGHYGRLLLPGERAPGTLFDESRWFAGLGNGRALCIDYSIAKRWKERLHGHTMGPFRTRLAALRYPERELWFDDGTVEPVR
jgi:hypothetical protein